MIYTAIDNFYVTEEKLAESPSRADNISQEIETQLRIYGCEIIQEAGILLKLPQAVMATGQVLLHRFYCKESMLRFNIKRVAWACCWLATKLEETPRRIRDLLSVFIRIDKRREDRPLTPLDIYSKEYMARKQELVNVERHLLRTFGFILHVDHPHKFVLNYLNILEVEAELKQEAWNLSNDSLRTTLCVRFKGETVACGIIFLAARRLKIPLPENPPWWEVFKVKKADVFTVAREVHTLYQLPKMTYISVYRGQHQSPKDSKAARDVSTPMVSPTTAHGTPGLSGPDSEPGGVSVHQNKEGINGPGSGGSADRASRDSQEAVPVGTNRKQAEDDQRRERHKRSRSDRDRERIDDADDSERHKHRHRRREVADGEEEGKEERQSRRDRDPGRKKERRDKEATREREREKERDRTGRDRSRDAGRDRDRDAREREKRRLKEAEKDDRIPGRERG